VLVGQCFVLGDDGMATPACDFGLGVGGVRHGFAFHQRGGERVDERRVA
jgi:hypothetical protein